MKAERVNLNNNVSFLPRLNEETFIVFVLLVAFLRFSKSITSQHPIYTTDAAFHIFPV
jgi:hypothetical protein